MNHGTLGDFRLYSSRSATLTEARGTLPWTSTFNHTTVLKLPFNSSSIVRLKTNEKMRLKESWSRESKRDLWIARATTRDEAENAASMGWSEMVLFLESATQIHDAITCTNLRRTPRRLSLGIPMSSNRTAISEHPLILADNKNPSKSTLIGMAVTVNKRSASPTRVSPNSSSRRISSSHTCKEAASLRMSKG